MYAQTQNNQQSYNRSNSYDEPSQPSQQKPDYGIEEVTNFCRQHYLNAVRVGNWIWVQFREKPAEQMLKLLKDFGFRWSKRRGMWAHNCGNPSQPGKEAPWHKYPYMVVSGMPVDLEETASNT